MKPSAMAVVAIGVLVLVSRLSHIDAVWIEEAYGLAAGAELWRGKALYRDVWFDKPPLYALYYASFGSQAGLPLRVAGTLLVLGICTAVGVFAWRRWGVREGLTASALIAFGMVFWIPSAVMAVAPDVLMMAPHVAAVYWAWRGRPVWAGVAAGVATLANSKGLLVVVACLVWSGARAGWVIAGFLTVQGAALLWLPGAEYWRQVWEWGWMYSKSPPDGAGVWEGVHRTANWAGFHATIVLGAAVALWRERDWKLAVWVILCLAGVAGGLRFFPRYYFQLLPVCALLAGRGLWLLRPQWRVAALALLLIPAVRFGPSYWKAYVGGWESWSDAAMMQDSRKVGTWLRESAAPGASLVVWGYRPDIYVFSGLPAASRFLDSQPLTGVLADRHLKESLPSLDARTAANYRAELQRSRPAFVVDGLGVLNPELALTRYADLAEWLGGAREVFRTRMTVVYQMPVRSQ